MERMTNELFELLTKTNTHDKKYFATDGSHVCSDKNFKHRHSLQVMRRSLRKEELQDKRMALNPITTITS